MCSRPRSSTDIATFMPSPSSPSRLVIGTRALSNVTSHTFAPCWPIFFSGLPTITPGVERSTMKADRPLAPGVFGSVRAITVKRSRLVGVGDETLRHRSAHSGCRPSPPWSWPIPHPIPNPARSARTSAITSPLASFGSQSFFWSELPNITMPWLPIPTLVPKVERKAGDVCPSRGSPAPLPPW